MKKIINKFHKLKILVIGDVMLDRFIYGEVERISPEAPVPVVKVTEENYTLGGAANVLNNIISLGAEACLCGIIGDDLFSDTIITLLKNKSASLDGIIKEEDRATIVKTRVIGHKQQIVRVDREDGKRIKKSSIEKLLGFINDNIEKFDAIIVSDYGKGLITNGFYKSLSSVALNNDKILNIDPKNSNMNIYKKATLLTPNIHEASYAANMKITEKNLESAGKKLIRKFLSKFLVITLGEKGMAVFIDDNGNFIHIPTVAKDVFDVTGAGDTVISVLTMAMALGVKVEEAAKIANVAAGIVVGKVGTATVTKEELIKNCESINI